MRIHRFIPLIVGLVVASCDETEGPTEDGRLVVSTLTTGEDPDRDGYRLAVDDLESLSLTANGTAELEVRAGIRTLRLVDVADHCSVTPGISLEVDVAPRGMTPVDFAISCPATGVRITVNATGLDIDPDGFRAIENTADRGRVLASGTTLILLDPGERTIALTDVAPNCAITGSGTVTVTVVEAEVVPAEFAAVCTATSGVIGVVIEASGVDLEGGYAAMLDGARHSVHLGQPTYLTQVAPGNHVISLVPPANCSGQTMPRLVILTAGGLVRDTAEVRFSVSCVTRLATLEIAASTNGTPPARDYSVMACEVGFYCFFYPLLVGFVPPNGTLLTQVEPGTYDIWLGNLPARCGVPGPHTISAELGDTVRQSFIVSCP